MASTRPSTNFPVVPDIVDVFRRSEFTPAIATEAVVTGAAALWLQLGIVNDEAMEIARSSGLQVSRTAASRWSTHGCATA